MSHLFLAVFCTVLGYCWGRAATLDRMQRRLDRLFEPQEDPRMPIHKIRVVEHIRPPDEAA